MADDLQRVGLVFKADGAVDFKKTLRQVTDELSSNRNEFDRAKISWDESTSSMEKLQDRQKYLSKQTQLYSDKVNILQRELAEMEKSEKRSAQEISKKKQQIEKTKTTLAKYEKGLKDVNKEIKSGSAAMKDEMSALDDSLDILNESARENETSFKQLKSKWEENTRISKKLRDEQSFLAKQTENYSEKIRLLSEQLKILENAEEKDEKAISKKRQELNNANTSMNEYKKSLDDVNKKLRLGNAQLEEYGKKIQDVGVKVTDAGKSMSKGITAPVIGAGVAAVKAADDMKSATNKYLSMTDTVSKTEVMLADGNKMLIDNAENFKDVISDIYSNNFGENLDDIAESMAHVRKNMGQIGSNDEIKKAVEDAITLRDIYEYDVSESTRAANTLMEQFGITADEAFNLIAQGAANGLDFSGELIDSINEYSVQFKKIGFSASDMFEIFASGSADGAFNLDKIGDAVKELSIRVIDGSDTTSEGFKQIGLNADIMAKKFASGGTQARDAFYQVIEALGNMNDPIAQNAAGVNLFGTMWEDLGIKAVLAMGDTTEAIDITRNTMEELKKQRYDDLQNQISGIGRTLLTEIAIPLGEELIPIVSEFVEEIAKIVDGFSGMSEEQKKAVITIGMIIAAIGPAITVFGNLISSIGKISKGISITLRYAGEIPGIMNTIGMGAKVLWGIMSANPIMRIITIVGFLITAFVTLYTKCEWFRDGVNKVFGAVRDGIKLVIDKIKNIMDFEWKLPDIKMPDISIKGKFSLNPPSVPKFYLKWNKDGAILNKPTIFGMAGGVLQGGGEAGKEAVLPIEKLKAYIREELKINNQYLADVFKESLSELKIICENNVQIGDKQIADIVAKAVIKIIDSKQKGNGIAKGVFA